VPSLKLVLATLALLLMTTVAPSSQGTVLGSAAAVEVGEGQGSPAEVVGIPVRVLHSEGILGLQFVLQFDPAVALLDSVSATPELAGRGLLLDWYPKEGPGPVRVAVASPREITADVRALTLQLHLVGKPCSSTEISLTQVAVFNEAGGGLGEVEVHGGRLSILYAADIDGDGAVTLRDLEAVAQRMQVPASGESKSDVNGDGVIDVLDLTSVARDFGKRCPG
jgi:hypothetical protein